MEPILFSSHHIGSVTALAVLGNGWIATGGVDRHVKLWDPCGTYKGTFIVCRTTVRALASVGKAGLAMTDEKDVTVWDVVADTRTHALRGHTRDVRSLVILSDETLVSATCDLGDKAFRRWDLGTGTCIQTLNTHLSPAAFLAALPNGRLASSHPEEKAIRIWDVAAGTCVQLGGETYPELLLPLPGNRLASSDGQRILVWDLETFECTRELTSDSDHLPWSLAYTQDGLLVNCGTEGILLWDTEDDSAPIVKHSDRNSYPMLGLPDGSVLVGYTNGMVGRLTIPGTSRQRVIGRCRDLKEALMTAAWNPERTGAEWLILDAAEDV
jgi:WD40 repeat protein